MKRSACKRARQLIVRDWDQRISLDDGFRLEEHLDECAACAELAARHAELDEAFARLPEPPTMRIDLDAAVAAVREQLPDESAEPAVQRSGLRLLRQPFTLAAIGGLAAAVLAFVLLRPTLEPEPAEDRGGEPELVADAPQLVHVPVPFDIPAPPDALEFARLEDVRATFRSELLAVGDTLADSAGIELLDETTRELRAAEWPLRSIAEGLLDDPEVAPAAVRYLGWRGNRRSATLLARRLDEPALSSDVIAALEQLGPHGFSGLGRALEFETTRGPALDALVRVGATHELARALRGNGGLSADQRTELIRGLAASGGLGELLELTTDGLVSETGWLAGLDAAPELDATLAELAQRAGNGRRATLVLRAVAHGRVASLLPWVERQTAERALSDEALWALSAVGEVEGGRSWLNLAVADRVDPTALDAAARSLSVQKRDGLVPLVAEVDAQGDRREGEELLSLLVLAPSRAAVPALLAYASLPGFSDDQRQWAVLTVAERGGPEAFDGLAALLAELDSGDRLLAAAVLQALHATGGESAVWEATAGLDRRVREELVAMFADLEDTERDRSSGRAVTLLELARRVGPALPDPHSRGTQP